MHVLSPCESVLCMPGACGGQKRVSGPRELELDMVVNHHVGTLTGGWDMAQW